MSTRHVKNMASVVVNRHGVEAVRRGHPWVYRAAIQSASPNESGIVTIRNGTGDAIGSGVFDAESPIALRVWSASAESPLGPALFTERLERALALRKDLFGDGATTAYRLANGEGDRMPGFVIDRYGDVAVLRLDGDAARAVLPTLGAGLEKTLQNAGITTLLQREKSSVTVSFGEAPKGPIVVQEHGVPFVVDLLHGQKTGAFLDQRENRRRIGEVVARKHGGRVLNLFSYTGGFSQRAALAGGVVTSVDVAMKAHATAQDSFSRAGLDPRKHSFVTADAFAWLAEAKKKGLRFDVVISDPPSFAPNERAKPNAMTAYRNLHRACVEVLAPGGTFAAASCSSHITMEDFFATLDDLALGTGALRVLESYGPPADHPTLPSFAEGRYLKLVLLA